MQTCRIIHISDTHLKKKGFEEALKSQIFIENYIDKNKNIDLVLHTGDVWDDSMYIEENTPFIKTIQSYNRISKLAPTLLIKGNHDKAGSINIFSEFNRQKLLGVETPFSVVYLSKDRLLHTIEIPDPLLIIYCIPYPYESLLLTREECEKDNLNQLIEEKIKLLLIEANIKTSKFNCYKIIAFHGSVAGYTTLTKLSNIGADYQVSAHTLSFVSPDYVACGHIHMLQNVSNRIHYAGSTWPVDSGETDQKYFYDVVLDGKSYTPTPVEIPTKRYRNFKIEVTTPEQLTQLISFIKDKKITTVPNSIIKLTIIYEDSIKKDIIKFIDTLKIQEDSKLSIFYEPVIKDKIPEIIKEISKDLPIEKEIDLWGRYNDKKIGTNVINIIKTNYQKAKEII